MNEEFLKVIKDKKKELEPEGFILIGYFGSFARKEQNSDSDLDILFRVTDEFLDKYSGLNFFGKYDLIKNDLERVLNIKIELADIDALGRTGRKYILPEVVNV